jgi:ABC-2 type transport system permease protein
LLPLDLLPGPIARVAAWLPFRFTLSVPVEILTKPLVRGDLWQLLGGQAAWTIGLVFVAVTVWNAGVRRFEAVGG